MANYGKLTLGASETATAWTRGHSIPAGTLDPADTVLKSVTVRVGATHTSQCRVAVWQGGTVTAPDAAVLIGEGITTGSAVNQDLVVLMNDEILDPAQVIWTTIKGGAGFTVNYDGAGGPFGDWYQPEGRSAFAGQGSDPNVAHSSPLGAATTGQFWYTFHLIVEPATGAVHEQEGFRFRDDDGSESGATFRQAQDVDDTGPKATNIRLRVLSDATGDGDAVAATLQVRRDDEDATQWRNV